MSKQFYSLSSNDARSFLSMQGQKHRGTHRMTERILHWLYCANCGLVNLKNDTTRRALRATCEWLED